MKAKERLNRFGALEPREAAFLQRELLHSCQLLVQLPPYPGNHVRIGWDLKTWIMPQLTGMRLSYQWKIHKYINDIRVSNALHPISILIHGIGDSYT